MHKTTTINTGGRLTVFIVNLTLLCGLAACGSDTDTGIGSEGAASGMREIGSVTVTVGGEDYVYPVLWDAKKQRAREFTDRELAGKRIITIGAFDASGAKGETRPRGINLMKQLRTVTDGGDATYGMMQETGMQNVTLYDAQSFANPLEATGMGSNVVAFTATGEDGVWAGTFEATLERQDPDAVEPEKPGTLQAPVAVDGFFTIELP